MCGLGTTFLESVLRKDRLVFSPYAGIHLMKFSDKQSPRLRGPFGSFVYVYIHLCSVPTKQKKPENKDYLLIRDLHILLAPRGPIRSQSSTNQVVVRILGWKQADATKQPLQPPTLVSAHFSLRPLVEICFRFQSGIVNDNKCSYYQCTVKTNLICYFPFDHVYGVGCIWV